MAVSTGRRLAGAILGVALGVLGFGLVPVFGAPFIGCGESAFGRWGLAAGCSLWPEVLRGGLLVAPIAWLAPRAWRLPVVAVAVLVMLSFVGGIGALAHGPGVPLDSPAALLDAFMQGFPNALGGLIVLLAWACFPRRPRSTHTPASTDIQEAP